MKELSIKQKTSFIINLLIFVFTLFATITMIIGFEFMGEVKILSSTNFHAFKYFTVDSNVFAGIVSLIYLIYLIKLAKGKISEIPLFLKYLKLAATAGVTLTMMVTVFYLAPSSTTTYFAYFVNSNFFMHFLTPVLCIVTFIFLEPAEFSFKETFIGVIPMIVYAMFYIPNILLHLENGNPTRTYDWYGFLDGGLQTIWFVIPLIMTITWLFSLGLWALNKKIKK